MGTRGLVGFVRKDSSKKGAYNHFDSYPEGLGLNIMRWIASLTEEQLKEMAERVENLEWVDADSTPSQELQARYTPFSRTRMYGNQLRTGKLDNWYNLLHRMQGAACLPQILDGFLQHPSDDTKFAEDGLFCEWAYWIDFSKRTLRTVAGFGKGLDDTAPFEKLGTRYAIELEWRVNEDNIDDDDRGLSEEQMREYGMTRMSREERNRWLDAKVVKFEEDERKWEERNRGRPDPMDVDWSRFG